MKDNRTIFERLDAIEAANRENKDLLSKILSSTKINSNDAPAQNNTLTKINNEQIVLNFLKNAKKSLRWLGNKKEFDKSKKIAIISNLVLIVFGIILTIVATICFGLYSTFTLFENIWLVLSVMSVMYMSRNTILNEMNHLSKNSPDIYGMDKLFMPFSIGNKKYFKVLRVLCIIAILCNAIAAWCVPETKSPGLIMVLELLFLGIVIFASIMTSRFYSMYLIPYAEGNNYVTKEKVVLVSLPNSKGLVSEEEFKSRATFLYE